MIDLNAEQVVKFNPDPKKTLESLRPELFPRTIPELIEVAPAAYLALDGRGKPPTPGAVDPFTAEIRALETVAEGLRRLCLASGHHYPPAPLEALWWSHQSFGDEPRDLRSGPDEHWCWRLLLQVPDFITDKDVAAAKASFARDYTDSYAWDVRLVRMDEGLCVQALHVGAYSEEYQTIRAMREFIEAEGLIVCGLHHEVYLNDPRSTAPQGLRTILRQPVRRHGECDETSADAESV